MDKAIATQSAVKLERVFIGIFATLLLIAIIL